MSYKGTIGGYMPAVWQESLCEDFKDQFPVLYGQAIQDGCSLVLCAALLI